VSPYSPLDMLRSENFTLTAHFAFHAKENRKIKQLCERIRGELDLRQKHTGYHDSIKKSIMRHIQVSISITEIVDSTKHKWQAVHSGFGPATSSPSKPCIGSVWASEALVEPT
jgi:hypothetical protein